MNKITVKIDGMMCGMCEAHICDTIRREFPQVKKVSASRKKKEASFLSDNQIDEAKVKKLLMIPAILLFLSRAKNTKSAAYFSKKE